MTTVFEFGRTTPEQGQLPLATSRLDHNGWGKLEATCRH